MPETGKSAKAVQWLAWLRSGLGGRCCRLGCTRSDHLEFAHTGPTAVKSGRGRGAKERERDIRQYPDRYALLCRTCHRALDQGWPQARGWDVVSVADQAAVRCLPLAWGGRKDGHGARGRVAAKIGAWQTPTTQGVAKDWHSLPQSCNVGEEQPTASIPVTPWFDEEGAWPEQLARTMHMVPA